PPCRTSTCVTDTVMSRKWVGCRSGSLFELVVSNQDWLAMHAASTFGITANHGAVLTKLRLQRLAAAGILRAVPVKDSEATAYGIEPVRIRLERAFDDPAEKTRKI